MNENSTTFQAHHDDQKSVLEQLSEIQMQRVQSNRMVLERRKSSKKMVVTSDDDNNVGVKNDDASLKSRELKEF